MRQKRRDIRRGLDRYVGNGAGAAPLRMRQVRDVDERRRTAATDENILGETAASARHVLAESSADFVGSRGGRRTQCGQH